MSTTTITNLRTSGLPLVSNHVLVIIVLVVVLLVKLMVVLLVKLMVVLLVIMI